MLQLIDDQTFAMHFHDLTLIGKDEVNEKYGVYPNKLVDFFTLVGDRAVRDVFEPSNNYFSTTLYRIISEE